MVLEQTSTQSPLLLDNSVNHDDDDEWSEAGKNWESFN